MSGITYLLSDMHVTDERPDITEALLKFLAGPAMNADAVYLLGDVFDYWVGDDFRTDTIDAVKAALAQLSQHGVATYLISGNRDFLIGRRFCKQTGIKLLPEHSVIDLYGESTLIMHGDTLCTLDVDYQKFRRKSRSWWWPLIMLRLPLRLRTRIAENYRSKSKNAKSMKTMKIMDVTPQEVENQMLQHQVKLLIHGHTHRQAIHSLLIDQQPARRIVLGDWYQQGSVLACTPDGQQQFISLPFSSKAV
ncbi:UDP-2,3-diacylglucosamine diphosphatase [Neiella marina]|uniref:UDP-2,3-diacylglucosamine hydrolase n=1 Tax=Neiella holothuriorum TaxID=2870530 RepID=A0ABS7EDG7_9GAMM|nr:UDP-2,3-diacylglucosamine diphosphatase [Neiella holothuriorum]MBW8190389.1 UDP-2,3-diacylglucosamine diphosphatase [Neiella holothuriorum]